jgi:hypothetical protein
MEHGRRTGWTGRPRPQHVSAHGASRTWQVTGLCVLPASHVHSGPKISPSTPFETSELNRQTLVFRNAVTRRKQRTATYSNRQNIRFWKTDNQRTPSLSVSAPSGDFLALLTGLPRAVFAKGSVCITASLPGSASQTEFAVTHSKQSTARFLTGSRIASLAHSKSSNIDSKLSEGCAWLRL